MNEMTKKQNFAQVILQTALICLWGALALLLAVLLILEVVSSLGQEAVAVREPLDVHSSVISVVSETQNVYSVDLTGTLCNTTNNAVRLNNLKITVAASNAERVIKLDTVLIPAYSSYEIVQSFKSESRFDRVLKIEAEMDGETVEISNIAVQNSDRASGTVISIYAILLVCAGWLLSVAIRKRYYLFQESRMQG